MKPAVAVQELGQSIWLDTISRGMLNSGEFEAYVRDEGVTGVTSNPTIFEKAIGGGDDYDDGLRAFARRGLSAIEIFEALAVEDVGRAADLLRPVYERTGGADGFVSIEVAPNLAHDTEGSLEAARRIWAALDRPNVMIKIPGTREGLPAIRRALAEGINVNITLLFSVERYAEVVEAYLAALEERLGAGRPIDGLASVASFFVSRVDTAVDKIIDERAADAVDDEEQYGRWLDLRGKAAIANAKLAYEVFERSFAGPRWERLAVAGARVQRPLWASTGTKDPAYGDTYYVDALIGPHTVDTLPAQTLAAFNDHGRAASTLATGLEEAHRDLDELAALGVEIEAVTAQLEREGVAAFEKSADTLTETIEGKLKEALGEPVRG